jgi:hypothetical protein
VPERHGFAVRKKRRSSCTPHTAHEVHLALRLPLRALRFHVHRIPPRVRDDARSPLWWDETVGFRSDLGQVKTKIFLISGLDTISDNQK